MVAVVIAFPITVTALLDAHAKVDLDKIKLETGRRAATAARFRPAEELI
ncbi:hypothetical protein I6F09_00610 [Bradyrhizobium sp. IC3195]|nr:hypothetical protein [Bradyrhizobium sp. IC3195]MCA1466383.1 hypothetical protein [Bradyrhizobium sp. IC3195]